MVLLAMSSLILGLVEGSRYYGLKEDAKEFTGLVQESLFAGYQPVLAEDFQMFFLDGGFGSGNFNLAAAEDEMQALLYDNFALSGRRDGMNLYRLHMSGIEITEYLLASDADGKVFEMQAAKVMKKIIGQRAARKILDRIKETEEGKDAKSPEDSIKDAEAALAQLSEEKESKEGEKEQKELPKTPEPEMENPMETLKKLRKQGILALVMPAGKAVSEKSASVDQSLLKRKLNKGVYKKVQQTGWYERILMQEFIKPFVGNAVMPKEDGVLSYGTEYLICGRGSDRENLKKTVNQLLLLREASNFLYLQTDKGKNAEAFAAAVAIAGITVNPVIIEAVKQGILAAWAYVESICDVKTLLSGGKVPPMKNPSSWKTQLSNLQGAVAQECSKSLSGLSYENYLDVLLYGKSVKQIAYRSMDLMEWDMQKEYGYETCKMDHMIVGMKLAAEYEANPLFSGIFGKDGGFCYRFAEKASYIYDGT